MSRLSQEQIDEVQVFQAGLPDDKEWLFYHLAWVAGDDKTSISFEDKYEIMQRWDEFND